VLVGLNAAANCNAHADNDIPPAMEFDGKALLARHARNLMEKEKE